MNTPTPTEYEPFTKAIGFSSKTTYARVDIKFTHDGRLSISGNIRDYGKQSMGADGQIADELLAHFPKRAARLVEIWRRWHLNDMRAGCEHQRAAKWRQAD